MIEDVIRCIETRYYLKVKMGNDFLRNYLISEDKCLVQASDRTLELRVSGKAPTPICKTFDILDYNSPEKLADDVMRSISLINCKNIPDLLPICTILMQAIERSSNPMKCLSIQ